MKVEDVKVGNLRRTAIKDAAKKIASVDGYLASMIVAFDQLPAISALKLNPGFASNCLAVCFLRNAEAPGQ